MYTRSWKAGPHAATRLWHRASRLALLLVLGTGTGRSPSASAASLTLLFDNDSFADTDHHYTSGQELLLTLDAARMPKGLVRAGRALPLTTADGSVEGFVGLGQNLFTPHEIEWDTPPADERPYAGWLYLQGGLSVTGERRWDQWDLTVGVVGPWALGEELQVWAHGWSDSRHPAGWSHQLSNEPGVVLGYRRGWRLAAPSSDSGWGWDVLPVVGAKLGNVFTTASGGLTLRAGRGLDSHRGPPRITPRISGSHHQGPRRGLGVQALLTVEGRLVARNLFLDGNSFTESPSVQKRWAVGTAEAGLVLTLGKAWLAYSHVLLSPEYRGQDGPDDYGSALLGLSW
jgi:lipid A 3-O-deacylase